MLVYTTCVHRVRRLRVTLTLGAKIVFLQFRQQTETMQGVLVVSTMADEPHQVSKQMLKYAQGIPVSHLPLQS